MNDRTSFAKSFRALTGNEPFRWQERLFQEFVAGRLPSAIDLPTGLGKTSVMAIWLIARALADDAARKNLPRRLVYVVDRRVVVDQATTEAETLAAALRATQDSPLLRELRDKLCLRADQELGVNTLRGGRADNREWTYDPAAPAIIVCTVDMAGSRLLFSGYRLSRWSCSVQAGLIGVDSLIVLDEAHIAPAFLTAMQRVLALRHEISNTAIPLTRFLPLSATPPVFSSMTSQNPQRVFRLEAADYDDPPVAQRTGRSKPTKRIAFASLGSAKGALATALAEQAAAFDGAARAVLVFCNSRADANAIADALRKQLVKARGTKERELNDHVALITGARRGKERDDLIEKATYRTFTYKAGKRDLPEDGRTRYLICTAAGEVGADLDADAAVMDLVPLERMIQRLGRVNRRGVCAEPAQVTIFYDPVALKAPASEKNEKKKAEAERLAATKTVLEALPPLAPNVFDASPCHLGSLDANARKAASTPPPKIPIIEREHVEAWALTSLKQHPGRPEVEPFLRGIVEEEPQTTIVWRADVAYLTQVVGQFAPSAGRRGRRSRPGAQIPDRVAEQALAAARLMPAEILEAPTPEVVQFLRKRITALRKSWEKAKDAGDDVVASAHLLVLKRGWLIGWGAVTREHATLKLMSGKDENQELNLDGEPKDIQRVLDNATLLLEPAFGGLNADGTLDEACDGHAQLHVQPEKDEKYQWGVLIRLVPPRADGADDKAALLTVPPVFFTEKEGLKEREITSHARRRLGLRRAWFAELPGQTEDQDGSILEYWKHWDPEGETGASSRSQLLSCHHAEAKAEMEGLVKRLELSPPLAETLIAAMPIHDTGKARRVWQIGMRVPSDGGVYAKSGHRGPGVLGYRHEFGSLRDALYKNRESLDRFEDDLKELALHLIASHHGRARPSILALDEEEIFPSVLEQVALEAGVRFVRLQRRWGPWGLAWLEALFRSVDATVSRRLERDTPATNEATE